MELSKEEQILLIKLEENKDTYVRLNCIQVDVLTSIISNLQEENKKQSKVIDEMANIFLKTYRDWEVNRYIFQYHICSKLQNPKSEEKDCYADVWDEQSCKECIKQYFYRKASI